VRYQWSSRRSRFATWKEPLTGVEEIDSQKSVSRGVIVLVRRSGPTPMMVTGWPFSRMVVPTTSGSPPSRERQAAALTTATSGPPATSCSGPNQRPRCGWSPSTSM